MRHLARLACLALFLVTAACSPVVMTAGPATGSPAFSNDALTTSDGAELPLRRWLPVDGNPDAVILALHGFNDYANAFDGPGEFLAGNNIAVFAYDQRGFGSAPDAGFWYDGAAKRRDLKDALRVLKDSYPGKPLYLLGESMGGAVVMTAAADPDVANMIDGAILSAPAVWGPSTQAWWQRSGLWLFAHTVPWMRPTGRGLGIQASDNIEMLRALGRDPKIIKKTRVDSVYGVVRLMDEALFSAPDLDLPLLILYGERDEVIPKKPTKQMLRSLPEAGRSARRIALYPEGWHMLLRDLQAETVWRDILAWIRRPDAPLPSGAEKGLEGFLKEKG